MQNLGLKLIQEYLNNYNTKMNKLNEKQLEDINGSSGLNITVRVPNVSGLYEDDAISRINNAGLDYELTYINHNSVPKGVVIKSDPSENIQLTLPYTIRLFVSKGVDIR